MSRFSGWTMKDVERLSGGKFHQEKNDENYVKELCKKYVKKDQPDYVGMISSALTILKVEHVREYKFLEDRRFRFDLAVPKHKIAVEWEGAIFTNGRHTRGQGYSRDCKKYNLATRHQWKLLRYTTEDAKTGNWEFKIATEILDLIKNDCSEI